ncbi:MAG TPA: hypothetical protein PK250_04810 [Syntrophobacter fumaroxidans]|nr:hypothetical protein [Syntrophobacter fumaroxidans]
MKTAVVLTIAVFAQAIGNACLSKGMKGIAPDQFNGSFSAMLLLDAMREPLIWLGTLLLILFLVMFSATLTWADLSLVLPATAFGYILNVFFGYHFLNETVSNARWAGTVLIFVGVVLVAGSGRKSKRRLDGDA